MRPPRASPQAKLGATNVIVFMLMTTKADGVSRQADFFVRDYDLAATLTSGQTFRWQLRDGGWEGVIGSRWVRLRAAADLRTSPGVELSAAYPLILTPGEKGDPRERGYQAKRPGLESRPSFLPLLGGEEKGHGGIQGRRSVIIAETATPVRDWSWLSDHLQLERNLAQVLATFPDDEPMRAAVATCRGLRLLRQDPWECLASFILSSSKQIVQIQQIVARLCERFGDRVIVHPNHPAVYAFPGPSRVSAASEAELRACKMGFRAPNLRATAQMVAGGEVDLNGLSELPVNEARDALMRLPGVGRKVADCVLLFACGFQSAFPVDVWVMKALRRLYFPRRSVTLKRLHKFAATHFGPCGGYAQQYLFHYTRVHAKLRG